MPVPVSSRNNKSPSQKAEEAEKQIEKAEAEANAKAKEELNKPEGEEAQTPGSDSAPDKEISPKKEPKEQKPEAGQPEDEAEEDLEEEEVQQLSAKAQKRYRKMAAEIKELKGKLTPAKPKEGADATPSVEVPIEEPKVEGEDFSDVNEPETPATPAKKTEKKKLPWENGEPDDDGEATLTEEELEQKSRQISQEETQKALKAEKVKKYNTAIVNRVVADVRQLETDYDILNPKYDLKGSKDPKSPDYNANYGKPTNPNYRDDIARTLVATYKKLFQADKRVRLLTFVKQQMGLIEQGRAIGKKEVESVVDKQNAEQPLTPSGGSPRKSGAMEAIKKASTLEELEAAENLL